MAFPLFTLDLVNNIRKKIKLKAFSEKSLKKLRIINEHQQNIGLFHLGLSGKNHEMWRKRFRKDIKYYAAKKFHIHVQQYQSDCQQYKNYQDALTLQALLQPKTWEKWLLDHKNSQVQLEELREAWIPNQTTNHLTSNALQAMAQQVLPLYEDFYELAFDEIKYYRPELPTELFNNLRNYLKNCWNYLRNEKISLCDAMLSRLSMAAKANDIIFDDVNYYTLQKLTQLSVVIPHSEIPPRRMLSRNLFLFFHHYISKNGSKAQKNKLEKLKWFKQDDHFYKCIVDNDLVIIPRVMQNFEPPLQTNSFFNWFLFGKNNYAQFYKEKFYEMAHIRLLHGEKYFKQMKLTDLLKGERWGELTKFEQVLIEENDKNQVLSTSIFNRLFRRNHIKFHQAWNSCVERALIRIVDHKIKYVDLLVTQLQTRIVFDLDSELLFSLETKNFLSGIINSMDLLLGRILQAGEYRAKWEKSKEYLKFVVENRINTNNPYGSSKQITHQLELKKKIKEEVASTGSAPLEDIQSIYQGMLKNDCFNVDLIRDKIAINKIKLLCQRSQQDIKQDKFWKAFFITYLNTCLADFSTNPILDELLSLLNSYGPKYFKNSTVSLATFSQHSEAIFKIKCRALLFSLQEKNTEDFTSESSTKIDDKSISLLLVRN